MWVWLQQYFTVNHTTYAKFMYIGTVKKPWGKILLLKMDWVISRIYRLQYVHIYSVKSTIVNIFNQDVCWLKVYAHNWFLKLLCLWRHCVHVCMCVCQHLRLLIIIGMIWNLYDWLNRFNGFYIAAVVGIVSMYVLSIGIHCRNQPNKCKLVLQEPSFFFNSSLK